MVKVQLNPSLLGWMLVPVNSDSQHAIELLYALPPGSYGQTMPQEFAFMKGEPIEKVLEHVKEICHTLKISISMCGKKTRPTLLLWLPHSDPQPTEVSVDLKWGCWTEDQGIWNEYAPGVWNNMFQAWKGNSSPLKVVTAPRKECRYGVVTIEKGKASGYFVTNWDELHELAETLETECDDGFAETIPFSAHAMEPGMDWEFEVTARSFRLLMKRIDEQENQLLTADREEWTVIENMFRGHRQTEPDEIRMISK